MFHEVRVGAIVGRDLLGFAIQLMEGDYPWLLVALLLLIDSERLLVIIACTLILSLPALKSYFQEISAFNGGTVEWLWEMNALGGQVLAGKDQLQRMFAIEARFIEAIIAHESTFKGRLLACAVVIVTSVLGLERAVIAGSAWYLLLKNTVIACDFLAAARDHLRFLHFYTNPEPHFSPNHLFTCAFDRGSLNVQLSLCIWENERKWWPAGWTTSLLRSDARLNFTDATGAYSFSPGLIKALKLAHVIGLDGGECGHWCYFAGDFRTPRGEGEAETRRRQWCWGKEMNLVGDWEALKGLLGLCSGDLS